MTAQFALAPQRGRLTAGALGHEPHAALLIDFDNVTMGIRSDITKELKNLLNSAVIKGKVAVQRAYADWRRYPQYIVPLAEASVDLIFAPAYGSSKKNATDIRLAIDALELVFTRPEIGTFILLSGDSDFSSLVLKLKEYGKYVIGVGIRESASDLLVQNCDEYYSYSALTGLTRAGDDAPVAAEDPWELVEMALAQMLENSDVMRSDRLKQVILELDPMFDEKALGFQKFNKFLQESAARGLISLRKLENGQFEVGAPAEGEVPSDEPREPRRGRSRRGRGRRGEGKVADGAREEVPAGADGASLAAAAVTAPAVAATPVLAAEGTSGPVLMAPATPAEGAVERLPPPARRAPAASPEPAEPPALLRRGGGPAERAAASDILNQAYTLLRRAASDLVRKAGQPARDSDVKRRMLELNADWDESSLGFSKFSRFLRQAHDAEVITLSKSDNGNYDVVPGEGDAESLPALPAAATGRARDRGRGRGRPEPAAAAPERASQVSTPPAGAAAAIADAPAAPRAVATTAAAPARPAAAATPLAPAATAVTPPAAREPSAAMGFRRGSRRRGGSTGPPPLLDGQAVGRSSAAPAPATAAPAGAEVAPAAAAEPQELPRDAGGVASYIASRYRGVGPKSVQTLVEAFGATNVFKALEEQPDRVREVLGTARGDRLLNAWQQDRGHNPSQDASGAVARQAGGARTGKKVAQTGTPGPIAKAADKTTRSGRGSKMGAKGRTPAGTAKR